MILISFEDAAQRAVIVNTYEVIYERALSALFFNMVGYEKSYEVKYSGSGI